MAQACLGLRKFGHIGLLACSTSTDPPLMANLCQASSALHQLGSLGNSSIVVTMALRISYERIESPCLSKFALIPRCMADHTFQLAVCHNSHVNNNWQIDKC